MWLVGLGSSYACGPTVEPVDVDALELAVWGSQGVSVYSVDGTQRRRLGPSYFASPPIWTPDGARVLFEGDASNVVVHDLAADETLPITDDPQRLDDPVLSPDGEHVAVSFGDWGEQGIGVVDLRTGELRALTPAGSRDKWIDWSPLGDRLLFHRVFGTWIIEPTQVMVADLASGRVERLTDHAESDDVLEVATWAGQDPWIFLAEGHPVLHGVTAVLDDQRLAVDEWVIVEAVMPSPTTNAVYYLVCNGDFTRACREGLFEPGGEAIVRSVPDRGVSQWKGSAWSPTGPAIAYGRSRLEPDGARTAIVRVLDLVTGDARDLAEFADYGAPSALAWSPDGRELAVALTLIEDGMRSRSAVAIIDVETGSHHFVVERSDDWFLAVSWRP